MFTSARFKLAAWYAGSLALIVAIIGVTASTALRRSLDEEIDDSISAAYEGLFTRVPPEGGPPGGAGRQSSGDPRVGGDRREPNFVGLPTDVFVVFTDPQGSVLSNVRQVTLEHVDFASLAASATESGSWRDVDTDDGHFRIASYAAPADEGIVHIGRSLSSRDAQLEELTVVFLAAGAAGLLLATAGGIWLAGRSLVPIRRAFESQQRFVSDASHELRTPIAVVRANNELLLLHPEQTIEENRDQVEAIGAEAEHLTRLIEDLLTFARSGESRLTLNASDFDLDELAAEILRDMAPVAAGRGLAVEAELAPLRVTADRQRIRQAVLILLDNALKFTPSGGTVRVRLRRDGKRAEISVSDTGPGIAPEHHARIFDRFFRVDDARTRSVGGTGLGLSLAKLIAEAHHGTLTVQSRPGDGSSFVLRIP